MSAKPVRLSPSAEDAVAAAAAPAALPGGAPRKNFPPSLAPTDKRTDSISAGIRRIVEEEKRTERHNMGAFTPSDRSHTDKEGPGSAEPQEGACSPKPEGELKAEGAAGDGGEVPLTGRSRLEQVIKQRKKSKGRSAPWKGNSDRRIQKAKRLAEANEEEPVDPKASAEEFPHTDVKESAKEEGTKESAKESPKESPKEKKAPHHHAKTNVKSIPTDSRSCVHVNYLALYDRLVEEEKKDFESKFRRKITIRFAIIFAVTTFFFLALTITFASLHFGAKECKKED